MLWFTQTNEMPLFVFYRRIQKKLNNNWKSVLGPNIFPKVTPPNSKGHSCEQSPLCCLFKDHFTCCIWHEHPLSYNGHSTPLEKGAWLAPSAAEGGGKDGSFLERLFFPWALETHAGTDTAVRRKITPSHVMPRWRELRQPRVFALHLYQHSDQNLHCN